MRELKETDDITFAIAILHERRKTLTPYSPLGMKLAEAAHTLSEIKSEKDKYLAQLSAVCARPEATGEQGNNVEVLEDITDLSSCDEETKAQILENAEKLSMQCKPCQPTSPECDDCDFGGVENENT
jgi:hypothetical protein